MPDEYVKCGDADCNRNASRTENGRMGFCSMHYQRFKKYGKTDVVKPVPSPARDWLIEHKHYIGADCLKWPFHIGADGYGRVHQPGNQKLSTASRAMCILAHGEPLSPKHEAAHLCGNGSSGCVNPNHLYWATPTMNQHDRIRHGTSNRGTRQGNSRLTEDDVWKIRSLLPSMPQADIAAMFGVDQSHISNIARGKQWAWLV